MHMQSNDGEFSILQRFLADDFKRPPLYDNRKFDFPIGLN
jgi:hypothetical protein